ncbi:DUF3332 domain-containing protein [Hyalangium versicolor]|uniref:DUF3332 domain-containing protein n=1 Tax=Hyalangium versicolor TaxID=2861190 RepID=UPI001CCEA9BD|nr:DUF3332 domain-containing protein [Hyalangium versicolor]
MKRASRLLVVLCLAFFSVHASGCFGKFTLTRAIWDFNKNVSPNKFIQWLVFLVLVIVPVYEIGSLVDALVINSIEFWTGQNPVSSTDSPDGNTRVVRLNSEDTLRLSRDPESGVMKMELERAGKPPVVRYFEPLDDGMAVRDDAGAMLIQAREQADGAVAVTDAAGNTMALHSAEAVAQARQLFLSEGAEGLAQFAHNQVSPLSQGLAQVCTAEQ